MDSEGILLPSLGPKKLVVRVRKLQKHYGFEYNKKVVLEGVDMNVERGTIYGVLGASACGKTTLLSCIVGLVRINGGEVMVLGGKPGGKNSGVPGPKIGYMPQESSLIERFTIAENLNFFALLCGKGKKYIKERIGILMELLDLPSRHQFAGTLSGGQMRRLSLAIALVHEPELLVLDEPTNGLDPLLRVSIWEYLCKMSTDHKTTVIMTTHYIEEARQANRVGFLRNGVFLVEDCPDKLLNRYNKETLEEVFLHLAFLQENNDISEEAINEKECPPVFNELYVSENQKKVPCLTRIFAVFSKHLTSVLRNKAGMVFMILLPTVQILLFCNTIGEDPKIKVSVVNEELQQHQQCSEMTWSNYTCDFNYLSCQYLAYLQNRSGDSLILKNYATPEEGRKSVQKGWSWGLLSFRPGYSQSLIERFENGLQTKGSTLETSNIEITLDKSNADISAMLSATVMDKFVEFVKTFALRCNWNPRFFDSNVKLMENVHYKDENHGHFVLFCAPGLLLTTLISLAIINSGSSLVTEVFKGTAERSAVCGVTKFDEYAAQIFINLIICAIQIIPIVSILQIYNFPQHGSWAAFLALLLSTSMYGIATGLLVATAIPVTGQFTYASQGLTAICFYLSGVIWPVEGMVKWLRYLVYMFPWIDIVEGQRSIMYRGWGFNEPKVYYSLISANGYAILNLLLCCLIVRIRSKST